MEAVTLTALAKLPADRFATEAAFAEALGNPAFTLAGGTTGARWTVRPSRPLWRRVLYPAAVLVPAVVAVWSLLRPQPVFSCTPGALCPGAS